MRILVYSSVFYPAIGGIENHSLFLVKEFVKAGHEVRVITEQEQDPQKPLEHIEILQTPGFIKQVQMFYWSDVLYMPNITLKGAWLIFFNPFKKWVISHNDFHLQYSNDLKTKLKWFLIRMANKNISVSKSVAKFLKVPSEVIYNCYDDSVFKLYPEEQRKFDFVFVGRLVSQKGCELLIDACKTLDRPFTLNIIGDGFEMEKLKAKVEELRLGNMIKFLGFRKNEELARMLNQHRIMIVPSLDVEGFGIVALEGLACGCHMVVSNAGGLSEAVDGFGDIFQMGDATQLASFLKKALDMPYKPINENKALMQYLDEHSKLSVAKKYISVFQSA
jgi:glycogen(starch) synthase